METGWFTLDSSIWERWELGRALCKEQGSNQLYPAHRFWTAKAFDQLEPNGVSDIIYYGPQKIRDEVEAESADDDGFKNCHGPSRSSLIHFVLF
jgi:hypothetical protein